MRSSRCYSAIKLFFLFFALFVNEDILVFGTIQNSALQIFRLIVQVVLALFMLFYVMLNRMPILKVKLEMWGLFCLMILSTMLWNRDFRNGYLVLMLTYSECLLLTTIFSFEEIYGFFSDMMYLICGASLVGFGIQVFAPYVLEYFPAIRNIANRNFYFLGITNVEFKTDNFIRNWGPFREPGVFQAFIIVALIYTFFEEDSSDIKRIVVYILALLTTFSTTGYIALACIIFAAILINKSKLSKQKKKMIYTLLGFCCATFIYMSMFTDLLFKEGYGSVFGKIAAGMNSKSFSARAASISINLIMFMQSPFKGKGITYNDEMFTPLALEKYGLLIVDNTNMLFILLARFGLPFFACFAVRYMRSIKKTYNFGMQVWLLLCAAYFVLMIGENFSYSILMNLPLFIFPSDLRRYEGWPGKSRK